MNRAGLSTAIATAHPLLPDMADANCPLYWRALEAAPYVLAAASILNAMADDPATAAGGDTLSAQLPPAVTADVPFGLFANVVNCTNEQAALLLDFVVRHDPLLTRTRRFCADDTLLGLRGGVEISQLTRDWRAHCLALNHLLSGAPYQPAELDTPNPLDLTPLIDGLARAASGDWPSLSRSGGVEVLGFARQRRSPRWPVSWRARLELSAGTTDVQIVNVSKGGFGCCRAPAARPGDACRIILPNGRRIAGTVAWTVRDRLGAQFATELSIRDPLIIAAMEMSGLSASP